MKLFITIIALTFYSFTFGQGITKRVLFLGNSYIYSNDLPQMLADVASSVGDSVYYDSNTPGGYTLKQHATNTTTLDKIAVGNWDYVILQEQSQQPSLPIENVEADVFPYARILDSTINADNVCPETVFYMTWGRKFGDLENCWWWPPVCTYEGQDSLVNLRYRMMADSNDAIISPVGQAWRYIRENYPEIELYKPDSTHPSPSGSYVAACCFYSVIFRKDPTLITYDYLVSAANAEIIRNVAKLVAYDSLDVWHVGEYDPQAIFTATQTASLEFTFNNYSQNSDTYLWDFGDGGTSTLVNPVHTFPSPDAFLVSLTAANCFDDDYESELILVKATSIQDNTQGLTDWNFIENPASEYLSLQINQQQNLSFQIFDLAGILILSGELDSPVPQIKVSTLPAGMYILKLYQNNNSIGEKEFVKTSN